MFSFFEQKYYEVKPEPELQSLVVLIKNQKLKGYITTLLEKTPASSKERGVLQAITDLKILAVQFPAEAVILDKIKEYIVNKGEAVLQESKKYTPTRED
ncbi:MAG: hypothetical protein JO131_09745 [Gammaproteobacteria bacterium]|nr:hypothetical protein [Gammaproteobacteria bacterium]